MCFSIDEITNNSPVAVHVKFKCSFSRPIKAAINYNMHTDANRMPFESAAIVV